jgi:single-strand DNA-binding protein
MSYANTNRVILVGRLTRDPELRALASGSTVCGLRIACNGVRKDGEVYQERPNYFDVSVFGSQGENVERYLRKGSRLAIDGRLEWREWETGEQKRQAVCVVADSVEFLDSPASAQREGRLDGDGESGTEEGELVGVGGESDLVF